ncbi:MAG: peptidylprolyl isomerase [Desulfobacterales bacterium]|nr:peptidylprolyl isomerase [Desulfobacterales bacterium]
MLKNLQIKRSILLIISLCVFFALTLNVQAGDAATDQKVAVKVNGSNILQKDVDREVRNTKMRYESQGTQLTDAQFAEIKEKVIDEMITLKVLYQECMDKKVVVDDAVVANRMKQLREQFPDELSYKQMLGMMGFSEADLKEQIKEQAVVGKYIEEHVSSKIDVTEEEIKTFYDSNPNSFKQPEQVRASHILIKVDQGADEHAKAKALTEIKGIEKKLKSGETFSELAKAHSQCPSASRGGDLDYFGRGQMVKPFEDTAFSMKAGDVSDIVETRFGYHIIKVTDKKEASVIGFEQARSQIGMYLKQQKVNSAVDQLVNDLKAKSNIQVIVS